MKLEEGEIKSSSTKGVFSFLVISFLILLDGGCLISKFSKGVTDISFFFGRPRLTTGTSTGVSDITDLTDLTALTALVALAGLISEEEEDVETFCFLSFLIGLLVS